MEIDVQHARGLAGDNLPMYAGDVPSDQVP